MYEGEAYINKVFNSGSQGVPVTDNFLMDCYDQASQLFEDLDFKPNEKLLDTVNYLEKTFDCSGVIEIPLFYVTRSHLEGPPKRSCGEAATENFGNSLKIFGIIMIVNAFFNFMIFNI